MMMNCLFWNCRGANKPNFRRSIRYILKKFKTDFLALFETHAGGDKAMKICQSLGFENSFRVDAIGQRGGIWVLWRDQVGVITVVESSDQFVHVKVVVGMDIIHLVAVYAAPTASRRSGLWGQLKRVLENIDEPVMLGGDFNTIVRLDERTGGNGRLSPDSLAFGDWINELALVDMGFKGNQFTWRRGKETRNFVAKRLDRVLCSAQTRVRWQEAVVSHLPFLASDHAPVYVQLEPEQRGNTRRRPFRFEAAWLKHDGFKELLSTSWNRELSTPEALVVLKTKLQKWNKEIFGDVRKRKEKLLGEIKEIQEELERNLNDDLLIREATLQKEFDVVLEQEEVLWYQKSREKWIVLGDRNTNYYHTSTIVRRKRNKIEMLKDDDGRWIEQSEELQRLAINYYKRLYSTEDISLDTQKLPQQGFTAPTWDELVSLNKPFSGVDMESAVRSMGKYKAPGPDGFQPVFYQDSWEVVGESVTRCGLSFFESGVLTEGMNDAMVVLIPKVIKPEKIMQFRPISLCNVLFKTITKAMVLRLKKLMPKLIGPAQASFIPGRLSTDNIIVVQEAVHSMRRKKGRKGWMLLKLDLEKAYDRIRWDFLEDTLYAAKLPHIWIKWIMECVTNPGMSLLWNGERTEAFTPQRGLRQGDPLSPYLFVLCMERLCHQIEFSVANKEWKPITLSRGGPSLSHVCFADDLILFAEASLSQIRVVRKVLERFCEASGQKVSLAKSLIFFSENVHRDLANSISNESGIKGTKELGKYLGMPVLQKRINKETFGEVIQKVASKLAGWKRRFLSMAGRITLTKSVLASIPVHIMSSIALPVSILEQLDRIARSFIWGSGEGNRKQHMVAWERICKPKREGGLGLRSAKGMNIALLAKLGWRLLNTHDGLWVQILRKKFRVGEIYETSWLVAQGNWSPTWRSLILGIRQIVVPSVSWILGDGHHVRFWKDNWLLNEPLQGLSNVAIPEAILEATARDLWQQGVGWLVQQIEPYISHQNRLRLATVVIDEVTGARDRMSWGESKDGIFSVKSAYAFLTRDDLPRPNMEALFARVWRVMTPERVRVFLWLVSHQVIMTNMERKRRHMSDNGMCTLCRNGNETILHALRDCQAAAGIWRRLMAPSRYQRFCNQPLLEWLYENLAQDSTAGGDKWPTLFALTVWWCWKWRCGYVFGETGKCRDRVQFVKDKTQEVIKANNNQRHKQVIGARMERQITWTRPMSGWCKLNTDEASKGNPGLAAAGGVIRDENGRWKGGFAINIGICSAPLAELWGVYYGLCIAWDNGIRRLEVEVDSESVVGFLKTGIHDTHPLSFLVRLCYGFISRDWIVKISHVYREANRLADGLANYAFSLPYGLHFFELVPEHVTSMLSEDFHEIARTRKCCM
ncbi:hypothetical protein YC2023_078150 [Brassica napus]